MSKTNTGRLSRVKSYFKTHPGEREVFFYLIITFLAFLCDLLTRFAVDMLLSGWKDVVKIWIFPPQAAGTLIAFLCANIVAKVVSYILNRKTTFQANNSRLFSIISYTIMCVSFIIIETIIGAPLQNGLYTAFGGQYSGSVLTTTSALWPARYQLCGSLSQIIYGLADFIAAFFLDKYIIMRRED